MRTFRSYRMLAVILSLPLLFLLFGLYQEKKKSDTALPPDASSTFGSSLSTKDISFSYPPEEFGLATTKEQVLVKSYIPPCDESFLYCLYYIGNEYRGTNFESAGLRIQKRNDLSNEKSCLEAPSSGYSEDSKPANTVIKTTYSTSHFANLGDGAAGHYASGDLYRLFVQKSNQCYEFETRIGQTQFLNYPKGTIEEFTKADENAIKAKLKQILETVFLVRGEHVVF